MNYKKTECQNEQHSKSLIIGLCLFDECQQQTEYCEKCLIESHSSHQEFCVELESLSLLFTQNNSKFWEHYQQRGLEDCYKEMQKSFSEREYYQFMLSMRKTFDSSNQALEQIRTSLEQYPEQKFVPIPLSDMRKNIEKKDKIPSSFFRKNKIFIVGFIGVIISLIIWGCYNPVQEKESEYSLMWANFVIVDKYGDSLLKEGKFEEALKVFEVLLKVEPNSFKYLRGKGVALLNLKKYQGAKEVLQQALQVGQKHPGAYEVYFKLGAILQTQNESQKAIINYDKAIELYPNMRQAYLFKGIALINLNLLEYAIKQFDKALQLDSNQYDALNQKAKALVGLQRFKESLDCYQQSLKIEPDQDQIKIEIGKLNIVLGYSDDKNMEQKNKKKSLNLTLETENSELYVKRGEALSDLGQFREAIEMFNEAINLDPNNAFAYLNQGKALSYLQRYEKSNIQYDKAIDLFEQINPQHENLYNALRFKGRNLLEQKEFQAALIVYDKAIKLQPNNHLAIKDKGLVLSKSENFEEAIPTLRLAIKMKPEPDLYLELGRSLYLVQNFEQAIQNLNEVGESEIAVYYSGMAFLHLRRYEEAIKIFDELIQMRSDHYYYSMKGMCLCFLGRFDEALASLDKAFSLESRFSTNILQVFTLTNLNYSEEKIYPFLDSIINTELTIPAYGVGNALAFMGRDQAAIEQFDKVLFCNPNYYDPYISKAQSLLNLKKFQEAKETLQKARGINPKLFKDHYLMGKALVGLEFYEEALGFFDKAYSFDQKIQILNDKCNVLKLLKQFQSAQECYEQSLQKDNQNIKVYLELGLILSAQKKYEKALELYIQGSKLKPQSQGQYEIGEPQSIESVNQLINSQQPKVQFELAWLIYELKKHQDAISEQITYKQQKCYASKEIVFQIGQTLFDIKDYISIIENINFIEPKYPEQYKLLLLKADALSMLGQGQEAITLYEKVMTFKTISSNEVSEILKKIEGIQLKNNI